MLFLYITSCITMGITAGYPSNYSRESAENEVHPHDFPLVTRSHWKARVAKQKLPLSVPVPYVVIHHSYTPPACTSFEECCSAMRSMQDFHMDERGWWDIGYNFGVGSDGYAYEGRGWEVLGAHALHFNSVSIGICIIGDWTSTLPPAEQIKTAKTLIAAGVELGYIKPDYKLVGHRQVRSTECPGDTLYHNIKTWDRYSKHPSSVDELINVEELPESVKNLLRSNCTNT